MSLKVKVKAELKERSTFPTTTTTMIIMIMMMIIIIIIIIIIIKRGKKEVDYPHYSILIY